MGIKFNGNIVDCGIRVGGEQVMNNDMIVLERLEECGNSIKSSMAVEHALADIKDTFQTPVLAKIPFTEIAALGGSFSSVVNTLSTPTAEGIYRCVFPKGVTGTLAMAKDGSGALGTIMNSSGIAGQARWIPVDKAVGPACLQAMMIAVAVLAVVKQINDIKEGQKEIIEILERDKKSQLLADYDILVSYMDDYKFYWENETSIVVYLNQVSNIKRNSKKDILSYVEQIEGLISTKKNILKIQSVSQKIGKILNRFIHYKLALHVFVLAQYMEVMLSKNFQEEYLNKISNEIREQAFMFRNLYTECYNKIELLKWEAVTTQAAKKVSDVSKTVGNFIGKIPVISKGPVDEFLVDMGANINEAERGEIKKTLNFFIQYKDSGLLPIAEHIDMINKLSNQPTIMVHDNNVIQFYELERVV